MNESTKTASDENVEQAQSIIGNNPSTNSYQQCNRNIQLTSKKYFRSILLVLFVIFIAYFFISFPQQQSSQHFLTHQINAKILQQRLPRILWIYTQNQRDAELMENDIFVNYYAHYGQKAGYEVRFVNSWSSYNWFSNKTVQKITKAMQNSHIDEGVHTLLKLILLYENGGVMLEWGNLFLTENFSFLEEMLNIYEGGSKGQKKCNNKDAFLFMPERDDSRYGKKLSSSLIAAVPGSIILKQAFQVLTEIMISGKVPYQQQLKLLRLNPDTKVNFIENSLQASINIALLKYKRSEKEEKNSQCVQGIQSIPFNIDFPLQTTNNLLQKIIVIQKQGEKNLMKYLQIKEVKSKQNLKFLTGIKNRATTMLQQKLITGKINPLRVSSESYIYKILSAPGNKEVFLEPLPEKKVQLCIVVMDALNSQEIKSTASAFNNQTLKEWTLVIPTHNTDNQLKINDKRVIVMKSGTNKVHNMERAVTRHCPHRGYAILLNKGENFNSLEALKIIENSVKPYYTAGLLISLSKNRVVTAPKDCRKFNRLKNFDDMVGRKTILNHFRVFSVQSFKTIPQFQMRDMYNRYHSDRIIALMQFFDYTYDEVTMPSLSFIAKKFNHLWEVPLRISFVPGDIQIQILQFEEINQQQLKVTARRLDTKSINYQLGSIFHYKIPFSKIAVFNEGKDFVSVDDKKGPDLIPKIIHQAWLGSKLPPAKKYFYQKSKKMYPSFQVKLWTSQNITRQKFPTVYEVLQTLIKFDKISRYGKLATVVDILRHQVLYQEGGFWKDAGVNFLRPILHKFLKYKVVIPFTIAGWYRYLQGMCFYGNIPRSPNLGRITNIINLNRMRIYISDPFDIAGPVDFRQFIIGQEEYDSDILTLPYQTFYPGMLGQHRDGDLCTKSKNQLLPGQKWEVEEKGWYLLSNCADLYPYAYGQEHNRYGGTWVPRYRL